jgi:beta-RFAP synthase
MIRVTAPSRLHFGLLSLPSEEPSLARRFGSVGLMVSAPGVAVQVRPAAAWSAEGPLAERALDYARRFAEQFPEIVRPHQLRVEYSAPEHMGLGTGTQLGLAVARALAVSSGRVDLDGVALARCVGRGQRSALGIHGFAHGGFLVEAGKRTPEAIGSLVARADFPPSWCVVLVLPPWRKGLHGVDEGQAFAQLQTEAPNPSRTDALCRLVLLDMLPALAECDLETFGEAVYEFNRRVGEMFHRVQGGTYAHPHIGELVEFIRRQGVHGVGQSSWGPAVCAFMDDTGRANHLVQQVRDHFSLKTDEVFLTRACNRGGEVEKETAGA